MGITHVAIELLNAARERQLEGFSGFLSVDDNLLASATGRTEVADQFPIGTDAQIS